MARIDNGPLAAQVHGSIGEVEFRWTRDGQVAQSKTVSGVWTTPAALLTKDRFRNSMSLWNNMFWPLRQYLTDIAKAHRKAHTAQWVSSYYRLQQGHIWDYPDTSPGKPLLTVVSTEWRDGVLWGDLRLTPDYPPWWAFTLIARGGQYLRNNSGGMQAQVGGGTVEIGVYTEDLPCVCILFPFWNWTGPITIGRSTCLVLS